MLKRILLALALLWAPIAAAQNVDEAELQRFARTMRLQDGKGFVETVHALRTTKKLPERYITKRDAEAKGWRPGRDLCDVAHGRSIGGDRFGNFERRLPDAQGRRWFEADLDFNCGRRGAKRLVFSSDGLIYVTVDHYESFREVPK
jgi:hypothetical protein